jgi:putative nucleotidyltransferase with HDIG domain
VASILHNKEQVIMNRDEALAIVNHYVKNPNLVKHMLAVEAAMRFYAMKFGKDEEKWVVTGLLHDFDWEIHPTMEEHPMAGEPILRERHLPEDIIRAVLSHATHTGIKRESLMERTLFACDEVTGLITAVALVRPSKALYDLKAKSVKKKWKDKSFAAGADREEMEQGAIELGIDLWEHVDNVITAMNMIAADLDLAGSEQDNT